MNQTQDNPLSYKDILYLFLTFLGATLANDWISSLAHDWVSGLETSLASSSQIADKASPGLVNSGPPLLIFLGSCLIGIISFYACLVMGHRLPFKVSAGILLTALLLGACVSTLFGLKPASITKGVYSFQLIMNFGTNLLYTALSYGYFQGFKAPLLPKGTHYFVGLISLISLPLSLFLTVITAAYLGNPDLLTTGATAATGNTSLLFTFFIAAFFPLAGLYFTLLLFRIYLGYTKKTGLWLDTNLRLTDVKSWPRLYLVELFLLAGNFVALIVAPGSFLSSSPSQAASSLQDPFIFFHLIGIMALIAHLFIPLNIGVSTLIAFSKHKLRNTAERFPMAFISAFLTITIFPAALIGLIEPYLRWRLKWKESVN